MESPEDIEKALSRLMPSAMSGKGQRSLEELVDHLAAGESAVMKPARRSNWAWVGGIGAAAAAVVVAVGVPWSGKSQATSSLVKSTSEDRPVAGIPTGIPTGIQDTKPDAKIGRSPAESALQPVVFNGGDDAPWLGAKIGRLDEAIRAHVPELPEGIGFVVTSVDHGGPAEKAGMKAYDILWKLDDQLISNHDQLTTLIRLRKEGEEIPLGVYRQGRVIALNLTLEPQDPQPRQLTPEAIARAGAHDVPMIVVNPAQQTARIDSPDGNAELSVVAGMAEIHITSSDGVVVFEGPLFDLNGVCLVPEPWKSRAEALERALVRSMKESAAPRTRD